MRQSLDTWLYFASHRGYFERCFEVHRRLFEQNNRDLSNNWNAYFEEKEIYAMTFGKKNV